MGKQIVINISDICRKPKKFDASKHFTFRWKTGNQTYVEGHMARMTDEQQVQISVEPKTDRGRAAAIDGAVTYSSSDETVATVTSADGIAGVVVAVGVGVCQIKASFDADMDVGEERHVEASGALEVVAAEAETAEIIFGTPGPAGAPVEPPVEPPVVEPPVVEPPVVEPPVEPPVVEPPVEPPVVEPPVERFR